MNSTVYYGNINYGNEEDFKNAVRFVQYLNLKTTENIFQTNILGLSFIFF